MQRFDWPRGAVMERGGAEACDKLLRCRFVFLIITNDSTRLSPLRTAVCACQGPALPTAAFPSRQTLLPLHGRADERGPEEESFQNKTSKTHRGTAAKSSFKCLPFVLKNEKNVVLTIFVFICLSVSRLAAAHASHQRVSHEEKPEAHRPERHDPGATAGHSQRPALPN